MESMELKQFFQDKKVFVTGHTGFKGAWLCWWLKTLGAEVTGFALPPVDTRGNLFNLTTLKSEINSIEADINDLTKLTKALQKSTAQIVLHLAAQPLVLASYDDPVGNYQTNVMGTINMLEAIRQSPNVQASVMVTTDKCYENKEWLWPYKETDQLGGHDPYSSSKAMAEIAISAYYRSFLKQKNIGIASARAGNVIGGGDFADNRIIPDIVESIVEHKTLTLRNPNAIRPWQHVLDALYGYLQLTKSLYTDRETFSTSFNFSPQDTSNQHTVEYITQTFIDACGVGEYCIDSKEAEVHEATNLRLDASKARSMLCWQPAFTTQQGIGFTASWYKNHLNKTNNPKDYTLEQIATYNKLINQ
nr:CDP-glucose 4,6-dehydratase [Candidatus Enterovibrio escacola]